MKKITYSLALATALITTSCSDKKDVVEIQEPMLREPISFTMADASDRVATRATLEGTRAGFTSSTDILMHIQSDEKDTQNKKYTRTTANAAAASNAEFSVVTFYNTSDGNTTTDNIRYWDDCFGRKAQLSVYAVAVPNKTIGTDTKLKVDDLTQPSTTWGQFTTTDHHNITWEVSKDQSTDDILADEDLVYSNNISEHGTNGVYVWNNNAYPSNAATGHTEGRMTFRLTDTSNPTGPGHFDKGHMDFNHSLSRITIELIEGTGFDNFQFKDNTQIQLNNMHVKGTLAIDGGDWTVATSEGVDNITQMQVISSGTPSNAAATYQAQMLPKYVINQNVSSVNMVQFTIDDNTYYITEKMVFDALKSGSWYTSASEDAKKAAGFDNASSPTKVTMAQGHNYTFKITVNKTKIESITATIAEWSNVKAADESIDNAHFTITDFYNNQHYEKTGVHLFRITEALADIWANGSTTYPEGKGEAYQGKYADDEATMTAPTGESNIWKTNWYFNDNKTLYHVRSLNDLACKGAASGANDKANLNSSASNTTFNMENGDTLKSDYHWGAPMQAETSTKFKYDEGTGFKSHLHKGLPATNSTINITELHMMSNINVIVRTPGTVENSTVTYGVNGVKLEDNSTKTIVTITRLYNKADVDMGIGLVTEDKTETTSNETGNNVIKNGVKAGEVMTTPTAELSQETVNSTNYVKTGAFTFAVVPQHLCRAASGTTPTDDDFIGITIKTPDNNEYYVVKKLSEIKATAKGSSQNQTADNTDAAKIIRWYPNHSYTYTFTITKKGIESMTCTLAPWSEVKAADTPIDLEN